MLITPKLQMPPLRAKMLPREHLHQRMTEGIGGRLLFINGPAGSGKTLPGMSVVVPAIGFRLPGIPWMRAITISTFSYAFFWAPWPAPIADWRRKWSRGFKGISR